MLKSILNCNKMDWQDAGSIYVPGTMMKMLRDDEGGRTLILKIPAGFKMEEHAHVKTEQHLVLKGQYEIGGTVCGQGTYQMIHAHETHGPFTSETGAEILVVWH